jgi:carbamoyl-phosphate synthase large subunit
VAPAAKEDGYLNWLSTYIEQNEINLFIPTSESEIDFLNKNNINNISGAHVLIANYKAISYSLDKYACMAYLKSHMIRVPSNGIVGAETPSTFPVIVKPRAGQGSKQIKQFNDIQSFNQYAVVGQIWQEYLCPDDQEYTCPVYKSNIRGIQVIVMRRTLVGGLTGRGEIVSNPEIEDYVKKIAESLDLNGSINIQLRLTAKGACLFEINPRLSSTLVFRDKMGFCDLRWWIQDSIGAENCPPLSSYAPPVPGTRFFRGVQEYITSVKPKN